MMLHPNRAVREFATGERRNRRGILGTTTNQIRPLKPALINGPVGLRFKTRYRLIGSGLATRRTINRSMPIHQRTQIGAVSYLNSKPLVEGLADSLTSGDLTLDFPSRLADGLAAGALDVALIPSIEYFRQGAEIPLEILSDACVAAHGPVLSVKLYTRKPWAEIKTLALDEGSRTSATLARILLAERFGVTPRVQPWPLTRVDTEGCTADAILLIGDRAILPPAEQFLDTWDLGEEWKNWTGLPFVFAMWVARRGVPNRTELQELLEQARDRGEARLLDIAHREAPLLGLEEGLTYRYLSQNLAYHLNSPERAGLRLFCQLARQLHLVPANAPAG